MRKNIFIVSQKGVNPLYNQWVKEAAAEFMEMIPNYKNDYPISNLGNWKDDDAVIDETEYLKLSKSQQIMHFPTTQGKYLVPYASVDWLMAMAKKSAYLKNRPHQMNASVVLEMIKYDPTVQKIPQITINLVKDDIFATTDGQPNNFVYGIGEFDTAMVLSTYRYEQAYATNPDALKEVIKTVVMHEMGHIFGATVMGRHNVSDQDGYGPHYNCPGCIMQTESKTTSDKLTYERIINKTKGKPALCEECIGMVEVQMAKLSGNSLKTKKAVNNFNFKIKQTRGR